MLNMHIVKEITLNQILFNILNNKTSYIMDKVLVNKI